MKKSIARRPDAPAGTQEIRLGKNQGGRQSAGADQFLRPVTIGQNGVDELARCISAASSERHSSGAMTRGTGSNCHGCSSAAGRRRREHIIRDALFMQQPAAGFAPALQFRRAQLPDGLDKSGVMRGAIRRRENSFVKEAVASRVIREQVGVERWLWLDGCLAHL